MNSANHRSNRMTKMTFHRPAGQPHPRTVLIAAETFDEALLYLRFHSQAFNVHTVRCLGVILMVSGSPAD